MKARGLDLADFGPGEPDFPTPEHIKNAAIDALAANRTKYTPTAGIAPLREAVCAWHARQFGTRYEFSECVMTVGGKHAIYNAVSALIEEGDEVLIPAPYWVSFPEIVRLCGGEACLCAHRLDRRISPARRAAGCRHYPALAHGDR